MKIKNEFKVVKMTFIIVTLLILGVTCVTAVSANEQPMAFSDQDEQTVITLFKPIDNEIRIYNDKTQTPVNLDFQDEKTGDPANATTELTVNLVEKYSENLNQIVEILEKGTGIKLSAKEQTELKMIIVQEHIGKSAWEQTKERMGVKDEDFKPMLSSQGDIFAQTDGTRSIPDSPLVLVQVEDDVDGGWGLDGAGLPYNINGDNDLYFVETVTYGYYDRILYQLHFLDEDAPVPAEDASYDAFRLLYYGTIVDVQGFFITFPDDYDNKYIIFGNDWDNGCSFGTYIGQHGENSYLWSPGLYVFVSNVWNHAMGVYDRNSNMAKITTTYY